MVNTAVENVTGIADTHAPALDKLEGIVGHAPRRADDVVRVQVYDNAPYYVTWYNEASVSITIDGVQFPSLPMLSSGGQIFRAEIPGNLVGDVEYTARSVDEYGNTGFSATRSYTNLGASGFQTGGSTPSSVGTPFVDALSKPLSGEQLYLYTDGVAPGSFGFLLVGDTTTSLNLGDGILLNVDPAGAIFDLIAIAPADANGQTPLAIAKAGGPSLEDVTLYVQYLAADGAPATWASSRALGLNF